MATAPPRTSPATVLAEIRALAEEFARVARERQGRRELARADFDRLRDAGFLLAAVPREEGGLREDAPRSIRQVSELIRILACGDPSVALVCSIQGKTAIAELAESVLLRICRVMGGGTFSRHSPYGFWLQDVRSLGYLRPTWGAAYDRLLDGSWALLD